MNPTSDSAFRYSNLSCTTSRKVDIEMNCPVAVESVSSRLSPVEAGSLRSPLQIVSVRYCRSVEQRCTHQMPWHRSTSLIVPCKTLIELCEENTAWDPVSEPPHAVQMSKHPHTHFLASSRRSIGFKKKGLLDSSATTVKICISRTGEGLA